jgi:hypothetical protein
MRSPRSRQEAAEHPGGRRTPSEQTGPVALLHPRRSIPESPAGSRYRSGNATVAFLMRQERTQSTRWNDKTIHRRTPENFGRCPRRHPGASGPAAGVGSVSCRTDTPVSTRCIVPGSTGGPPRDGDPPCGHKRKNLGNPGVIFTRALTRAARPGWLDRRGNEARQPRPAFPRACSHPRGHHRRGPGKSREPRRGPDPCPHPPPWC